MDRKFKIGDRVCITGYIGLMGNGLSVGDECEIVAGYPIQTLFKNRYVIRKKIHNYNFIQGDVCEDVIELDVKYYRELKLNELLDENRRQS
jgi:hypothetical protein